MRKILLPILLLIFSCENNNIESKKKKHDNLKNSLFETYYEIEKLEKSPMSIYERSVKLKNIIFENEADYLRDQKTIDALNSLEKESVIKLLNKIISPQTRRMINVLSFAENHKNTTGIKTSFDNLATWKKSRAYE